MLEISKVHIVLEAIDHSRKFNSNIYFDTSPLECKLYNVMVNLGVLILFLVSFWLRVSRKEGSPGWDCFGLVRLFKSGSGFT